MIVEHLRVSPLRRTGRHEPQSKEEVRPEIDERELHYGAFEDGREILRAFANVPYTRRVGSALALPHHPDEVPTVNTSSEVRTVVTGSYRRKLVRSKDDAKNTISARELCRKGLR